MKKIKAVIYARFSPRRGASTCLSNDLQIEACRKYAADKGWKVESEHADAAVSGASTDGRDGFKAAMRAACKRGRVLVVHSLSRIARNVEDALRSRRLLEEAGADLVIVTQGLDSSTPVGRLAFTMLAATDQMYREIQAELTSERMLQHQANGRRMGSIAPYGWKAGENGWERDEMEQIVLLRIVSLAKIPLHSRYITEALNNSRTFARNGKPWDESTIRRIVRRQRSA